MSEKKIKVTIEYDGQTHSFDGYTILGYLTALPKDAAVQAVTNISFGRLSPGDRLSAVVAVIATAKQELKSLPQGIRDQLLNHAINQGLNGGL